MSNRLQWQSKLPLQLNRLEGFVLGHHQPRKGFRSRVLSWYHPQRFLPETELSVFLGQQLA